MKLLLILRKERRILSIHFQDKQDLLQNLDLHEEIKALKTHQQKSNTNEFGINSLNALHKQLLFNSS